MLWIIVPEDLWNTIYGVIDYLFTHMEQWSVVGVNIVAITAIYFLFKLLKPQR